MIEDELRTYIIAKYNSIRNFSQKANMPYTTIDSMLKRGINRASVTNVLKLCKSLDIDIEKLVEGKIVSVESNNAKDNADTLIDMNNYSGNEIDRILEYAEFIKSKHEK